MFHTKPGSVDSSLQSRGPLVSIGLPVYNGEAFLKNTLEAILQQTFDNFELIISDNASTDATEQICSSYALQDKRIRYHRNERNLGAARNYNQLVDMANGNYFKWAAADDLIAPEYLAQCVAVLNSNPDILVCQTAVRLIDENNQHLQDYDDRLHIISDKPHVRLSNYLFRGASMWNAVFGLIRLEQLRKTPLIGTYLSSDQVLLGEIILRGKVYQIPERLFSRRIHPGRANGTYNSGASGKAALAVWFDPDNSRKYQLPKHVQLFFSYMSSVRRVPLNWHERLLSYFCIVKWGLIRIFRQAKKMQRLLSS